MPTDSSAPAAATWLTPEAHARLQKNLEQMTGPVRADIVRKIEAARDEGDLKENGGYHAAKEEQGKLEARIRQLTQLLRDVRVGDRPSGAVVEEGCLVTVDYGDGDDETFLYASRENATDEGGKIGSLDVYSPESPIGQALAGHKQGDQVTFGPRAISVTVKDITPFEG
ncbi:MAG: transcription elongation factor GreA [Frankiales bacterium]|nr:transcription elongation factor GreA [Frankiales bacterium]MCW2586587.1 transcription elongation factor GreA [Frankiales bacterium]